MIEKKPRIAVVLFNLGGPDRLDAVRPFLFNLFRDPAIIRVPNPLRWFLAQLISRRRAPFAREIYSHMGGGSPLLPLTEQQAEALKQALIGEWDVEVFVSMRYWHPMAWQTASAVRNFAPEHVIALPLYPQYSTTTTASSFKEWRKWSKRVGVKANTSFLCCYPTGKGFINAYTELTLPLYEQARAHGKPRILFSAHGLPEKVVKDGDPYQWQVEHTVEKIITAMGNEHIDYSVCYQSRVGPLKWIGPSTDEEIIRAGKDGVPLVVVPVSFVSEHSETLVELDVEYAKLAQESGVPYYARVPAVGTHSGFIAALAKICRENYPFNGVKPAEAKKRYCREDWKQCPCAA